MKTVLYLTLFFTGLLGLWSCNEDTYVDPVQLTTVRGQVLLSLNKQPVRNATVKLTPTSRIVSTDSSGNFRFDSVIAGKYTVQASKASFGTEFVTVETNANTPSPVVTILLTDDKTQNRPPDAPTLVAPAINSTAQSTTLTLKWKATDPNRDTLRYDVKLFRSGSATPTQSFTGLTADSVVVNLDYNTTYLWQVVVNDGINTVNGPVWSFSTGSFPDYTYLFTRRINGQYQIYASNATGKVAQLTRDGSNWRPVASPNRQQIAFISNVNTDLHLFMMNADGSNIRQVTTVPIAGLYASDLSFCWSPDGTQLVYPSNNRLYAVQLDGTGLRTLSQAAAGRIFAGCDWTAQGNRIAARTTGTNVYDNQINTFLADGSQNRVVYVRQVGRVGNPVFSVNGRQLLFAADSSGFMNEQGRQLDSRLFLLDVTTFGLTDLSSIQNSSNQSQSVKLAGTNDIDPRFSPTGAQIIFTNTDNTGLGVRSVYTVDLNGSGQDGRNRKLLFTNAEMPYWR